MSCSQADRTERSRSVSRSHGRGRRRLARSAALLLGSSLALVVGRAAPALAGVLTISPLPGTPDASPQTQISILGTAPANIASVTVTGSESGPHEGHLERYSANQGASFVLNAPFAQGEQVNVVVELNEGGPLADSFSVAHQGEPSPQLLVPGEQPAEQEDFVSAPGLHPPKVQINKADPSLAGDMFLTPLPAPIIHVGKKLLEFEPVGPNGPMILNPEGKLIWWDQLPEDGAASNLQLTTYEGRPVIAWWQGIATEAAFGEGEGIIANTSYEPIARVKAGNGYMADIHELNITPSGQAYIDAYTPVCLPTCSEANPPVLDAVVEEIDIPTGLVMWEWHALGHIPVTDTEVPPAGGVWDPYHVNSVQPLPEHRVLVSLRDTSSIYELDEESGAIRWTLGGIKNSFKLGKGVAFHFQHDARLEGNRLTLFDNEAGPPVHGGAKGLTLRLNQGTKKANLVHTYERSTGLLVVSEGSVQRLHHGNVMVAYGTSAYFSEFSGTGELLFDAQLAKGDSDYRVFRFPWSATPKTLPAVAATRESPSEVAVYASWNGATDLASWEVLAGESAESLTPVATAAWGGFETKIGVASADSVFEVRALDGKGKVLASSNPVSAK